MLQLNARDKPIYSTPAPAPDNGPHANRWNPFEKEGDLKIMNTALEYLAKNATGIKSCDGYFRNLAKEAGHKPRSLTEMITGEDRLFISYDPTGLEYGRRSIIHITVGRKSLREGHKMVAATIIHELAHINGAASELEAENALLYCGLRHYWRKAAASPDPSQPTKSAPPTVAPLR